MTVLKISQSRKVNHQFYGHQIHLRAMRQLSCKIQSTTIKPMTIFNTLTLNTCFQNFHLSTTLHRKENFHLLNQMSENEKR